MHKLLQISTVGKMENPGPVEFGVMHNWHACGSPDTGSSDGLRPFMIRVRALRTDQTQGA